MRKRIVLPLAGVCLLGLGMGSLLAQTPAASPDVNPEGNTGALKAQITTGGSYDAHSGNATRSVNDLHVPGALGVYGLDFTRYWNSVPNDHDSPYAVLPISFGFSGWSHSWEWHAQEEDYSENVDGDGSEEIFTTAITITFPDGHANRYKITRSNRAHGYPPHWAPPDPRCGPPYTVPEQNGFLAGGTVYDYLGDMASDGSAFWLYRPDGGSVHFEGGSGYYYATEVFDPHGFHTTLRYNNDGRLDRVEQDGGRWLTITWNYGVITRVETGGYAGSQGVDYQYATQPGNFGTLSTVTYPDGAQAVYTYANCYGDYPCSTNDSAFPMLKVAYDPHYAGAMTKIRYTYQGHECRIQDQPAPGFEPYVGAHFDYYLSPSTAIAAEKSDHSDQFGPIRVSSFGIGCFNGTRTETNGFGAWRLFNYGSSAGAQGNYHCMGYQLAKLTDFTLAYPYPNDLPFERQNYMSGQPRQIWDARGIETDAMVTPGDASGQPGEIHHVTADGSYQVFNRVNAGTSDGQDFAKIPNRYNHWLFSHRDERGLTTIYRRDSRRQVVDIIYPDTNSEHFTYNDWNQVVTHTLASHTSEHPAIVHYDYDGFHRLVQVWNEVDGQANAVIYTYDALERVATISYPWSRATGASFGVALTYNGRHQIIGEEYPATSSGPNPAKSYEYDDYGNCTAITDEMGHRSTYAYDDYRRCISYVEPLNAPDGNGGPPVPSRRWDWLYDRYIPEIGLRDSYSHTKNEWRVQVGPVFNYLGERPMTARFHDLQNRITLEASGYIQRAAPAPIGDWYWNPDVEVHYFSYDANGNKSRYTDPRGRVTTYDYDLRTGFGRPMRRSTQSRARLKRSTTPPATKRWSDFLIPPLSSGSTIRPLGRPSVSSTSGAIPPILIINGGR